MLTLRHLKGEPKWLGLTNQHVALKNLMALCSQVCLRSQLDSLESPNPAGRTAPAQMLVYLDAP